MTNTAPETSPALPDKNADKFLFGRDGWLFLNNDTNQVIAQITGKIKLTTADLRAWQNLLEMREAWARQRGAHYAFLVAPNKECIYPEQLPEDIVLSEARPLVQIRRYLHGNGSSALLYPADELVAAKAIRHTYPKGDTHWNWYGSYLAYRSLIRRLDLEPIAEADITFHDVPRSGDLSEKVGLNDVVTRAKLHANRATLVYNNNVNAHGNLQIFENEDQSLPRAVIFRDSFTAQLTLYLSQHFSRLVAVWQPNLDFDLLRREKPDFIISEQAERFLIRLPDDVRGPTNAEHVKRKSADQ